MNCPVCGASGFKDEMGVSRHIKGCSNELHSNWLESNGFNSLEILIEKGGLKKLAEYINRHYSSK